MTKIINDAALDQIFRQARTHRSWTGDPRQRCRAAGGVRSGPNGADRVPIAVRCGRVREVARGGQRATEAGAPGYQRRRTDDEGAGDRADQLATICSSTNFCPACIPMPMRRSWFAGKDETSSAPTPSATARLQGAYFIIARAPSASIAGRCRDLTTPKSTPSSSPMAASNRTSCATSAMAMGSGCDRAPPARIRRDLQDPVTRTQHLRYSNPRLQGRIGIERIARGRRTTDNATTFAVIEVPAGGRHQAEQDGAGCAAAAAETFRQA